MRILYSEDIECDLDAIAGYIAADIPRRAVSFIREIYQEIERVGRGPSLYRLRPDIGHDARVAVVGRYVIQFRFADDAVYIERVVYGGRDLPSFYQ